MVGFNLGKASLSFLQAIALSKQWELISKGKVTENQYRITVIRA
nr:hypothetical protein [Cylindrospermopsis raciborskii]